MLTQITTKKVFDWTQDKMLTKHKIDEKERRSEAEKLKALRNATTMNATNEDGGRSSQMSGFQFQLASRLIDDLEIKVQDTATTNQAKPKIKRLPSKKGSLKKMGSLNLIKLQKPSTR